MSFFKPEKAHRELNPLYPQQKVGAKYIQNLLSQPTPNFPTMQIPGMTPAEQQSQNLLNTYLNAQTPADFNIGMGFLRDTVQGAYDPMTGPQYQGYRNASAWDEEAAVNKVAGRAQAMGMYGSTPALIGEGRTRAAFTNDRMSYLGNLLSQERDRRIAASGQLMEGAEYEADRPLRKAVAAQEIGALPREIETQQKEAIYNAIMQQLMFPYTTKAGLAQSLMGFGNGTWTKEGGASEWDTIKGVGGDAYAIAGMLGLSDLRTKENIVPMEGALDKVLALTGYSYNYKFDEPDNRSGGVMAQDLEAVLPDAVIEKDGIKFVRYDAVIGLLVNAVKELNSKIENLRSFSTPNDPPMTCKANATIEALYNYVLRLSGESHKQEWQCLALTFINKYRFENNDNLPSLETVDSFIDGIRSKIRMQVSIN